MIIAGAISVINDMDLDVTLDTFNSQHFYVKNASHTVPCTQEQPTIEESYEGPEMQAPLLHSHNLGEHVCCTDEVSHALDTLSHWKMLNNALERIQ
jgi:hypothetical protein